MRTWLDGAHLDSGMKSSSIRNSASSGNATRSAGMRPAVSAFDLAVFLLTRIVGAEHWDSALGCIDTGGS